MHRYTLALISVLLLGCQSADDGGDDNPLTGDRRVDAMMHFAGHVDLDSHTFASTTPAANRFNSPNQDGAWVFQLAFNSDEAAPSAAAMLTISSHNGVVTPGEYPVVMTPQEEGEFTTVLITIGNQDPVYSVTAIGDSGTVIIEGFDECGAAGYPCVHGSFDLTGIAGWNMGDGPPSFSLTGTFDEVPVNDV